MASVPKTIGRLPHWARVAFAARCASSVLPLLDHFWSGAEPNTRQAIWNAIQLAEQSGEEARAVEGLDDVIREAVGAAGAAQLKTLYPIPEIAGNAPEDEHAAMIATCIAKAAEWAATAASKPPHESVEAALHAYGFARDAVDEADEGDLLTRFQDDLAALARVAQKGRWHDETPVPPGVFGLLSDEETKKPWWKIW